MNNSKLSTELEVSRDDLLMLVRSAICHIEGEKDFWEFMVIDDVSHLNEIADLLPYAEELKRSKAAILVVANKDKIPAGKPEGVWSQDSYSPTDFILCAADNMGFAADWTAIYPVEKRVEAFRSNLNLPANIVPMNLIPIFSKDEDKMIEKKETETVHWNNW